MDQLKFHFIFNMTTSICKILIQNSTTPCAIAESEFFICRTFTAWCSFFAKNIPLFAEQINKSLFPVIRILKCYLCNKNRLPTRSEAKLSIALIFGYNWFIPKTKVSNSLTELYKIIWSRPSSLGPSTVWFRSAAVQICLSW